ncbi:hypothetical protein HMPREF1550_02485 [Actinomyces sp. oral taxon 877 str. F0543]|nr:hypothetical protein HMPREF1550_02485 [Actinomyces sp. oral taxon 877 str. F0543]
MSADGVVPVIFHRLILYSQTVDGLVDRLGTGKARKFNSF